MGEIASPLPTLDQPRVFAYPAGLDERHSRTARNRRLGCWPLVCGLPVIMSIWVGLQGGPDAWLWWLCAAAFVLFPVMFELLFSRHHRRSMELGRGWITFDGACLRQYSPTGEIVATIDSSKRFSSSNWHVAGNWALRVRQGDERLEFTSDIDGATDIATEILRLRDPGESMD